MVQFFFFTFFGIVESVSLENRVPQVRCGAGAGRGGGGRAGRGGAVVCSTANYIAVISRVSIQSRFRFSLLYIFFTWAAARW